MFLKHVAGNRLQLSTSLLLVIACLAGCAQPFRVAGTWNEGATRSQTFRHLLVVGLSPDFSQRCSFEWTMARALANGGIKAIESCASMKPEQQLNRENIEQLVASLGVDGVIVTRLVATSFSIKEGGSSDTRGGGQYKATGLGYGYYGMPVVYGDFVVTPPIFSTENEFEIVTQLYETRGASQVYELKTKVKSTNERDVIGAQVSTAITAHMRKAGLLP